LEQPAAATPARQSAKINRGYLEPVVVILDVTGALQIGSVMLIMDVLLNLSGGLFQARR